MTQEEIVRQRRELVIVSALISGDLLLDLLALAENLAFVRNALLCRFYGR